MLKLCLSVVCSVAIALQVLIIAGCGSASNNSSVSTTSPGSGTGSGSGSGVFGGNPADSSPGCGGNESGYNNQNGSISGIWIQSPAPGENESNVTVTATAYATAAITQWTVCLDGQSVYQANNSATSISEPVTIPTGQHLLWASVTDADNDSNRSELRLIQVGAPPPATPTLPTPPANATVMTEMQNDQSNWSICSACAAGTNVTNNYTMTFDQSQPSLSGRSMEMYAGGPPWSNVLFKDILNGTTPNRHFLWDFWIYHDPAVEDQFWSSELDFYVVLSGNEFMAGSQCDFGDGYWNTWDSANNRWIEDGIPCPRLAANTWHHVQWYIERISSTQYRYDTLVLDGQAYALNQTWNTNSTGWTDQVGLQFQLDEDPSGTPLHEWVDKVTLTEW